MADQLPTATQAFGPKPVPTATQAFGPAPVNTNDLALGGADMDEYFSQGTPGRILDVLGQGFKSGWGSTPLGLDPEGEEMLKKAGVFNDYQNNRASLYKSFNEALIRPAAVAIDAATRTAKGIMGAGGAALSEAEQVPGLVGAAAATTQALMEAFPAGHLTGLPVNIPTPQDYAAHGQLPPTLARAADLKTVGAGEAGYQGLPEATQALAPTGVPSATERVVQPQAAPVEAPVPEAAPEAPTPQQPPADIHEAARQIAPDTFAEYDALSGQRDTFRQWIDEIRNQQVNAILDKVNGVESRLTDRAARALADARSTDTPEMAKIRQDMQATDVQMRDLAPDVSAAYRQAAEQFPETQAAEPAAQPVEAPVPETAPQAGPEQTTPQVPATAAEATVPSEQPAPTAQPASAPAKTQARTPAAPIEGGIAGDVSKQLAAAGRPAEEANAAGALVQAHYEARAARFEGAKGTAEDLYSAEAPAVKAGRGVQPAMEMAQTLNQTRRGSIRLATDNAKATIKLFKDADASTFVHETGHAWLEEMMGDAADPRAPDDLKADAQTIHDWLGTKSGEEIPTKAHEKFARGFERYMMEGHAPSAKLAGVFAKFRDWLTRIYQTATQLRSPINDDIRGVFDRMLATKDEKPVIAPETPPRAARELGPTASGAKSVYAPVPRAPLRLVDWLKKNGGLRDDTFSRRVNTARGREDAKANPSDIRTIADHPNAKGLIKARTGMSHDDAALKAWEEGYFPEHSERPTINDLYEAIRADLNGEPRYSVHDAAAVDAYQKALGSNAEIDRIANVLGVDPRDYTREQFFDLAAEQLSMEERAREIGAMDAEAERDFAAADERAKAFMESRGDAWEPDAIHDTDNTRSLEDLENAYKSETEAAGNAPKGEGGSEPPGPPAGGEEAVQGGVRQGGRSVGTARRSGASTGEAPTEPNASFGPTDDGLIDKAGNIRLDNLNQPEDIDQVFRDVAERNGDFVTQRRGEISDGQMLDLADAVGKDPAFLDRKKIGDAFSAEQILAARKMLVQSASDVRAAMEKAASGTDADLAGLAKKLARHEMIQGKVAQATAEWGRAGRAFRNLEGWEQTRDLNQFLKQNTGRDLNQLRLMARFGSTLRTPGQISRFVGDTANGKIRNAIVFYYINALISGPLTHLRYSVGNAINALWTPLVEMPIAATSGAAREALGIPVADRVHFAEASAQLYGLAKGFREGIPAAIEAWKYWNSKPLPGERIPSRMIDQSLLIPIPGRIGKVLGTPGRAVGSIHSFFKAIRYEQEIQGLAMRDALAKGLEGDARDLHVARLTESPTPEMMEEAAGNALKELYMRPQDYHSAGAALTRFTNSWLPAKIIAPFMRIGSEIVRNAFVERTPLGLASSEVRGNLTMQSGGAAFDRQIGKVVAGTGLMATAMVGVLEGFITGDGPTDPEQRRVWLLDHRPNSMSVGPITLSYQGLGHLGMLMRFASNMTETARGWGEKDGAHLAAAFMESLTHSVLDETFMRGVKDLTDAIYHPEEYGDRWIQNFATSWLPFSVGLGQAARFVDPYQRETRESTEAQGILDAARAHIPFVSETLYPRRDIFGEPITTGSGTVDRYANDKVVQAMDALHIGIGPVSRKIRGVQLTPQQYDDYARISGRMIKMELDAMVSPAFNSMIPAGVRIKQIKDTVERWREAAAVTVMTQSFGGANDIMAQANQAKAAALTQ